MTFSICEVEKNGMVDYFQELSFCSVAFAIYWAYLADQTLKKK
jgi:hypothetical protein